MSKITQEKFKKALIGTGGVYVDVAVKLQCHRSAITHFLKRYPKMMEFVVEERQKLIDVAENAFKEALNFNINDKRLSDKTKTARMRLKLKAADKIVSTLGKDRGWVVREQRELSGEVNHTIEPIKINVIMPQDVEETKKEKRKKLQTSKKKKSSSEKTKSKSNN